MKLSLGLLAMGLAAIAMQACSSTDDASPEAPAPLGEAGVLPPVPDASVPSDGGQDAADADAGPPRVCSDDGFCHVPVPKGSTLRGVWADGSGVAWAVSEEGAILRYDGATWTVHTKVKSALSTIWGSGPTDLWVGGADGVLHGVGASSNAITFTDARAPGDPSAPITRIWGTSAHDVWAVGSVYGVTRVVHYGAAGDAGDAWTIDGASSLAFEVTRVWGSAASGVWLAGVHSGIQNYVAVYRLAPSATRWSEVTIAGDPDAPKGVGQVVKLYDGAATADGTMWIVGRTNTSKTGYVRGTTADGGQTFTWAFVQHGPPNGTLPEFAGGPSASDAWLGGDYGRLGHWDGTAWKQAKTTITTFPEITPLHGMWSSGQDLWVVGDDLAMHRAAKKN